MTLIIVTSVIAAAAIVALWYAAEWYERWANARDAREYDESRR